MNQKQDNIATMFETTNGTLNTFSPLWAQIPAFADAVNRVVSGTTAIREKSGEQVPTGDAAAKAIAKLDLEETVLHIGDQLSAFAAKTEDAMLGASVDFSKSTLDRLSDSDLVLAARAVEKAAADHSAILASDYLITADDLTKLTTHRERFDGLKTAPRDAIVNRRVATLSLPEALTFVRSIYRNELDRMMTRFKTSSPDFYAAYFGARVIVDRAATHAPTPPNPVPPQN